MQSITQNDKATGCIKSRRENVWAYLVWFCFCNIDWTRCSAAFSVTESWWMRVTFRKLHRTLSYPPLLSLRNRVNESLISGEIRQSASPRSTSLVHNDVVDLWQTAFRKFTNPFDFLFFEQLQGRNSRGLFKTLIIDVLTTEFKNRNAR